MQAIDKVRDEMAKTRDPKITFLGEGVTALLGIHPEYSGNIATEGKTLSGCLEVIRRGARGGVSDPIMSTKAICEYYGIKAGDVKHLAAEVNMAMLGADVPQTPADVGAAGSGRATGTREQKQPEPVKHEEFDLDAMLGGL